jgi:hypothetical protein
MLKKLATLANPLRSFHIVCDSREQKPYKFQNSITTKLKAGDYSLALTEATLQQLQSEGLFQDVILPSRDGYLLLEEKIAVERKRDIAEFYACCTGERDRFERELARLMIIAHSLIVCEFSMRDLLMLEFKGFRKGAGQCTLNTTLSWIANFKIPILFCDNRAMARAATWSFFERFIRRELKNSCIKKDLL